MANLHISFCTMKQKCSSLKICLFGNLFMLHLGGIPFYALALYYIFKCDKKYLNIFKCNINVLKCFVLKVLLLHLRPRC